MHPVKRKIGETTLRSKTGKKEAKIQFSYRKYCIPSSV